MDRLQLPANRSLRLAGAQAAGLAAWLYCNSPRKAGEPPEVSIAEYAGAA